MNRIVQVCILFVVTALAFFFWPSGSDRSDAVEQRNSSAVLKREHAQAGSSGTIEPSKATPPRNALWASWDSPDPVRFIANLRAAGCPEHTIQDIVAFRLCREYRRRLFQLERQWAQSWDYTQNYDVVTSREQRRQKDELRGGLNRELESLLGVPSRLLKASLVGWIPPEDDYDFLPLPKRALVREIEDRHRYAIDEARGGVPAWHSDVATDAKISELRRQKQNELAAILAPAELDGYRLRHSPASTYALHHLPEAKSERDFRLMVQAVEEVGIEAPGLHPFAGRYGVGSLLDEKTSRAESLRREEKERKLQIRLRELLGEARLAELERAEALRQRTEQP